MPPFPQNSLPRSRRSLSLSPVPRIQLQGLSKRFGAIQAVRDLTIEVQPGSHHLLTGPSGSGKSTTLRLIAGLESPDSGQILSDGTNIATLPPERRQCGWVAQSPGLLPHLDLQSQLELPLRLRGLSTPDRAAQAQVMADRLGLSHRLRHMPAALSAGEAARTALGRALIAQPALLLLDEPFAHLDPALRRQLRLLLRELQQDHDLTILHVTHHPGELLAEASHVSALSNGRLFQSGSPQALYRNPRSPWLADLLGDCPVWTCRRQDAASLDFHLAPEITKGPATEILGLRPESLTLHTNPPAQPPFIGPVRIHRIAPTGPRTWIECRWRNGNRIEVPVPPDAPFGSIGDAAWLAVPADQVLRFDQDAGTS